MKLTIPFDDGETIDFECADTYVSGWVCDEILRGRTYPHLPFIDDVQVIVDVGANCGATTVYFAHHHPAAIIHSVEPGSQQLGYLRENVAALPGVRVHPIGLHTEDQHVPLYHGDGDSIMASILPRTVNTDESEMVTLRSGRGWAAEHGIDRIDILKVDVEGCETEVLESLADLLPTVKALYVEYDSRQAARDLDRLLDATHELYTGVMFLDQGECVYLRKDIADLPEATEHLRRQLTAGLQSS